MYALNICRHWWNFHYLISRAKGLNVANVVPFNRDNHMMDNRHPISLLSVMATSFEDFSRSFMVIFRRT